MATPNGEPKTPANVFDLEVQYGALAIALAYLTGSSFEQGYAARLGVPMAEMQMSAPVLLVHGFTVLLFSLIPTIAAIAYLRFIIPLYSDLDEQDERSKSYKFYTSAITWLFPLLYLPVVFFYLHHRSPRSTLVILWLMVAVYGINAGLGFLILRAEQIQIRKMGITVQLAAVLTFVLAYRGVAMQDGKIEEQNQEAKKMRLLIAPEAVDGVRQLGIHFGNVAGPNGAPQLSDPVSLAYPGDHFYFLMMPNGAVIRLSKDKVWGVYTEPN
jgi:cytochrome c biogenesis factor